MPALTTRPFAQDTFGSRTRFRGGPVWVAAEKSGIPAVGWIAARGYNNFSKAISYGDSEKVARQSRRAEADRLNRRFAMRDAARINYNVNLTSQDLDEIEFGTRVVAWPAGVIAAFVAAALWLLATTGSVGVDGLADRPLWISLGMTAVWLIAYPTDTARARAAYDWTRPHEGHRSFSDFISAALMREVGRLERQYHDGSPWPAVAPGQLPTGKPMRSS